MGKRAVRQSLTSCFEESSVGLWLFCQARLSCPVSFYCLAGQVGAALDRIKQVIDAQPGAEPFTLIGALMDKQRI
jgi:hypothetical protein